MKRYKTKHFAKWAKKNDVPDAALLNASKDFEKGLSSVNLGGNLYKIRIARQSQGKSSGFRTLLAHSRDVRLIFLYGFSKNERDNVSSKELDAFKTLSKDYLALSQPQIEHAETTGILIKLEDPNAQQD
jgi:hypothetical protein